LKHPEGQAGVGKGSYILTVAVSSTEAGHDQPVAAVMAA
jgi:hypothetical protein